MSKLEGNSASGGLPSSAAQVSDAAELYESQLGILGALKQRLTSSGRIVNQAAEAEESKIESKVLAAVGDKLEREKSNIISNVHAEAKKDLEKDLATLIQKNRDDEMKIINSSLASLTAEAHKAEKEYRDHTKQDIRDSMHRFGSTITSLLQGFIKKEHERSLEQKDERDDDDNSSDEYRYNDEDYADDREYDDEDKYDDEDSKQSSKGKSDISLASSQHGKSSKNSETQYEVPGNSNTQSEPMKRMQGKKARQAHHSSERYSDGYSDGYESDALKQVDDTEAKALGNKLPEREERLGVGTPALTQTSDFDQHKGTTGSRLQSRSDDDFGLKEAEDTLSKQVLQTLSDQKRWPSEERHQHHFHRHPHHHHDEYDDDDDY